MILNLLISFKAMKLLLVLVGMIGISFLIYWRSKRLAKYILKRYFITLLYVILIFVLIVCVIDYTEKNGEFIKNNVGIGEILTSYYLNFVPYIVNMLSPMLVFVSTIAVTATMAAHTEIIAMLAGGISFLRLIRTYFVGSLIVACFIFFIQGWILPRANESKVEFELKYFEKPSTLGNNIHIKVGDSSYVFAYSYSKRNQELRYFTLEKFGLINNRTVLKEKIETNLAKYDAATKTWKIKEYFVRKRTPDGDFELNRKKGLDTILSLEPADFEVNIKKREVLTLPELDEAIKTLKEKGLGGVQLYEVEKVYRYAYPFAIVILTLMGVIVSARKNRQGVGAQLFVGFLLAFGFIAIVYLTKIMADGGDLSPIIAAWFPIVLFGCVTIVLYKTVPK